MLNEALRKESAAIRFFENIFDECNTPQVKTFLGELIESRRADLLKIIQKLNEIHATSQALDGIASSYNAV
jgi:F0F1-type ATP synthase delta subunit